MTSIATPKDSAFFNLQNQAQAQGQMFESLKKKLETSSFDQLFKRNHLDQAEPTEISRHASASEKDVEQQAQKTELTLDVALTRSGANQMFQQVPSIRSVTASAALSIVQIRDQYGDALPELQNIKSFPGEFGRSDDESTTGVIDTHASTRATATTDIASQAVVVGIEGDRVRVWMRGGDTGLNKEQLISKIRAELSWAGMALETFVFNGKKLVGIK